MCFISSMTDRVPGRLRRRGGLRLGWGLGGLFLERSYTGHPLLFKVLPSLSFPPNSKLTKTHNHQTIQRRTSSTAQKTISGVVREEVVIE